MDYRGSVRCYTLYNFRCVYIYLRERARAGPRGFPMDVRVCTYICMYTMGRGKGMEIR